MGPMSFNQLFDSCGAFNHDGIEYYVERAKGGFGAIFLGTIGTDTEVEPLDPRLMESYLYAPTRFINRASELTERCAAYGTKVFGELMFGPGRNGYMCKTPSPVETFGQPDLLSPEITIDEIHKKQDGMIRSAEVAKKCGFAGVDLHALHWGYLLDEFLMPITNKREDEYGGSLENRMRVVTELIQGIHQVCGDDFAVTVGLGVKSYIKALNKSSLTGEEEAGRTVEEAIVIAQKLEEAGIAALLLDVGIYDSYYHACPPSYMPKGHALKLYEQITRNMSVPVIGRSRLGDAALCEAAVKNSQVDAVALARPALADPYFPRKIQMGIPEKIRPCIGCNVGCFGNLMQKGIVAGCAVNPRAGREFFTRPRKAVNPRKIAVIGGGAAGMQAAITAAECGHEVEIFEKTDQLGGEMIAAGAHDFKSEVREFRDWQVGELADKKVPIHLETEVSAEEVQKRGFDTVILAIGATSIMPASIVGIEKAVSAVDLLEGKKNVGKRAVVVGGGMVGCETAVGLALEGHKVTILEALPEIMEGKFVPLQHKMMLKDLIEYHNIEVITGMKLMEVRDGGILISSADKGDDTKFVEADGVVMSIGLKPNRSMADDYNGRNIAVYEIGAAQQSCDIYTAVHEGFEVAYYMD